MKKIIFFTLLILGVGFIASCDKEQLKNEQATLTLEGKVWKSVKTDFVFNGEAVHTEPIIANVSYLDTIASLYFSNGSITIFAPEDETEFVMPYVQPYSYFNGYLYIGAIGWGETIGFKITELTSTTLVAQFGGDTPEREVFHRDYYDEDWIEMVVDDNYKGKTIYSLFNGSFYSPEYVYYYEDKGVKYRLSTITERARLDEAYEYEYDKIVAYYDSVRLTFKAE